MKTLELANDILKSIQFTIDAHMYNPKTEKDTVRFWDMETPYIIHPTWCAMTILTETTLPKEIRLNGYKVLLWHDVLEDTKLELPKDTPSDIAMLVKEMTFESFKKELKGIWLKEPQIRLLKLYDKVSNLLDGEWMNDEKWNEYVHFTSDLAQDTQANYGQLNIVKFANAICNSR